MKPSIQSCPIDVHCHFFNKEILSLRLLIELALFLKSNKQKDIVEANSVISPIKWVINFLRQGCFLLRKYISRSKKMKQDLHFVH